MRDNLEEEKKRILDKKDNKRKRAKLHNLDDNQKEQLRKYEKGVKKVMRLNTDDEKKGYIKKEDNKRKKRKA